VNHRSTPETPCDGDKPKNSVAYFAVILIFGVLLYYHVTRPAATAAMSLLIRTALFLSALVAGTVLMRMYQPPARTTPFMTPRKTWAFLLFFLILTAAGAWLQLELEPPVGLNHWERSAMQMRAEKFLDTQEFHRLLLSTYNTGLGLFYTPVVAVFGNSILGVKLTYVLFFCVCLACLYLTAQKTFPFINPFYSFILIGFFHFPLKSLISFKWHIITLMAGIGVYVAGYGNGRRRQWRYHLVSLLILIITYILYRGAIIFFPLVFILISIDYLAEKKYGALCLFLICVALLAGFVMLTGLHDTYLPFKFRVDYEVSRFEWSGAFVQRVLPGYLKTLFPPNESIFYSFFLLLGMTVAASRFFSNWFCRYTAVFTVFIMTALFLTGYGLNNPDENHFLSLALCGLLFLGAGSFSLFILGLTGRRRWIGHTILIITISAAVCYQVDTREHLRRSFVFDNPFSVLGVAFLHCETLSVCTDENCLNVFYMNASNAVESLNTYRETRRILERDTMTVIQNLDELNHIAEILRDNPGLNTVCLIVSQNDFRSVWDYLDPDLIIKQSTVEFKKIGRSVKKIILRAPAAGSLPSGDSDAVQQ
jgi:hypothetical protein